MTTHIIPTIDNPTGRPFWDALTLGRLTLQGCADCSYLRFPAAERCPECWAPGGLWEDIAAAGTVWSHTTYHRALHPALSEAVPYTVLLVELDAGPTIPGRLVTGHPPEIGSCVTGVFTTVADGFTMLEWRSVS